MAVLARASTPADPLMMLIKGLNTQGKTEPLFRAPGLVVLSYGYYSGLGPQNPETGSFPTEVGGCMWWNQRQLFWWGAPQLEGTRSGAGGSYPEHSTVSEARLGINAPRARLRCRSGAHLRSSRKEARQPVWER